MYTGMGGGIGGMNGIACDCDVADVAALTRDSAVHFPPSQDHVIFCGEVNV
jgi:hypothetical protein